MPWTHGKRFWWWTWLPCWWHQLVRLDWPCRSQLHGLSAGAASTVDWAWSPPSRTARHPSRFSWTWWSLFAGTPSATEIPGRHGLCGSAGATFRPGRPVVPGSLFADAWWIPRSLWSPASGCPHCDFGRRSVTEAVLPGLCGPVSTTDAFGASLTPGGIFLCDFCRRSGIDAPTAHFCGTAL